MLEVRSLAFSYRNRSVLRDVSFVVSPGEIVSIVGRNGAGKTTLMRLLATLAVPDGGHVIADGQDAFALPLRYRRMIGYLPEKVALYDDMTIKDYLAYRAALKGEPEKRIRRRIGEAAEICRIHDRALKMSIRRLSAGERKRVALADAILLRPRILLLDDFLAGLDVTVRETAGEILSEAASFSSVIATGHELDDLARWSTRFLVLEDGVIAASVQIAGSDPAVARARIAEALKGGAGA